MPKEKIYDGCNQFDIEIGWGLGHDVQVGISTHDGRTLAQWLAESDDAREVMLETPDGERSAARLPGFCSLWASLDRASINRLITMLRKARDDSFGRDA